MIWNVPPLASIGPILLILSLAGYFRSDSSLDQSDGTGAYILTKEDKLNVLSAFIVAILIFAVSQSHIWFTSLVVGVILSLVFSQARRGLVQHQNPRVEDFWFPFEVAALGITYLAAVGLSWYPLIPGENREVPPELASCCFWAAILLLTANAGNYLVRAALAYAGFNPFENRGSVSKAEFRVGRAIGVLERWIATVLVFNSQYEALGVLFVAKGLVRSKALEEGGYSNYVVLGSLASLLIALAAGLSLQRLAS